MPVSLLLVAHVQESLLPLLVDQKGFEWVNDGKPGRRPKLGWASDTPGSTLTLEVDASAR